MKKSVRQMGLAVLSVAWLMSPAAAATQYAQQVRSEAATSDSPEDVVLKMFPFLNLIPRSFLIGDGYHVKLTQTEMRIDHMGYKSHAPMAKRTCMVGLTYMTPVAFFSSRIDIPLFASDKLTDMSSWTASSFGDYVLFLSRNPVDHPVIQLTASARF